MSYLRDSDREALRLAHELREEMRAWLATRGTNAPLSVSPFVDPSGQPSVLVTMSAEVAHALAAMLAEQRGQAPAPPGAERGFPRQAGDTGAQPRISDTAGFPAVTDTGGLRAVTDTGGVRALNDTGGFQQVHQTGGHPLPTAGVSPHHGPGGMASFPVNGTGALSQPVPDPRFQATYPQAVQPPRR